MDFSIRIDKRSLKDFEDSMRSQVPFATARALTMTAAQAKDELKKELPKHFILRNKYTANSIRHEQAKKKDWPNPKAIVGSISPYMTIQEDGGQKAPISKAFAIPKGIRRSDRTLVSRTKWPGKLLAGQQGKIPMGGRTKGATNGSRQKAKPFLLKEQGGVGLYVRRGKGRSLKRLYRLSRQSMRVKGQHWLVAPVERIVKANLAKNFEKALADALRTSR